jgi:hypothetical protein
MLDHTASGHCRTIAQAVFFLTIIACLAATPAHADEDATVEGTLIANGQEVLLPHVYIWKEKEGFYDSNDPTWTILFVERPLEARELGKHISDTAWVQIGVTETAAFSEQPELQVYSQSIKLSADSSGNISGGNYPAIELAGVDADLVSGRVWHGEVQEFFDDRVQYDFTFRAPMSDPNAPIGDVLPADGGEPGQAYLTWVGAIHAADIEKLKSIAPKEMADQLNAVSAEQAREEIEFMQLMTPTDVKIIGGSSDGETALLQIEGLMEGEKVTGEVTLTRMGDFWIPTDFSM